MSNAKTTKPKTKRREPTPAGALQRRKERRNARGNSDSADWSTMDSEAILELIARVTITGTNVTFGYTRDGGAYYISFYDGKESEYDIWRPTEDVDSRLTEEIESWKFAD